MVKTLRRRERMRAKHWPTVIRRKPLRIARPVVKKLIPLREAAQMVGMSRGNLRRLIRRENIPTKNVPVMTTTGVKQSVGLSPKAIQGIIARRQEAIANATPARAS
jgi:predicted DNA-binding transcriptional regulator AlpA